MSTPPALLGVDFGATSMRAGIVHADGQLDDFVKRPTPRGASGQLAALLELCRAVVAHRPVAAVGLGVPGIIRGGRVVLAANHGLVGDVAAEVQDALGVPVSLVNDAQAAAVFEARRGIGAGVPNLVYVGIGTGVGGAILDSGRLVRGRGAAGEFGHVQLVPDGPRCSCGAFGCWEIVASGRALAIAGAGPGQADGWDAASVVAQARAGDVWASDIVSTVVTRIGAGLANLAAVLDPDVIVLGGGVASNDFVQQLLEADVATRWRSWSRPSLRFSRGSDTAGVVGAAMLAGEW